MLKKCRTPWVLVVAVALTATVSMSIPEASAGKRSDTWITMKTKIALITADGVDAMDINVDTVRGRVTLHGMVTSERERARAEKVARKIDGVKEVQNLLQVVPTKREKEIVEENDEELEERIEVAFGGTASLRRSGVSVKSVNNGVVLLGGKARTLTEHLQALEVTRSVEGVRHVASQVRSPNIIGDDEIWREAELDETTPGMKAAASSTLDDMRITAAVKVRLVADPDIPAMDVNVDTRDGVVTLFGIVGTREQVAAAEALARNVDGVVEVNNGLQVVPREKQESVEARDEDLEREVRKELGDEPGSKGIDVEVKNQVVRLTGTVDSQSDRLAAGFVARSVRGVRSVYNDLQVEDGESAETD